MIEIIIEGATCGGCVKSIEKSISQAMGVESVAFNLDTKVATVKSTASIKEISEAIENAGFDVLSNRQ
jgi:copper chaperone